MNADYWSDNGLFDDENGKKLLKTCSRSVITWDDLIDSPLPHSMGAKQTWRALQKVRSSQGISIPFSIPDAGQAWYYMTHELAGLVARIERECHESYSLWQDFQHSADRHFLTDMRITDTLASTELDGLAISADEASSLIRYEQAPKTPVERIVKNSYAAFDRLGMFDGEPFTTSLVDELYGMVSDGVDVDALDTTTRRLGLMPFDPDVHNECSQSTLMDLVIRYANHEIGDIYDPPALRCMFLVDIMYGYHPLGVVSGQVGRLLSHIYARNHHIPLLSMLPLLRARIDWMDGVIAPPAVVCDRSTLDRMRDIIFEGNGTESTLHHTLIAQLACHLLDELKLKIAAWSKQDEDMRKRLQHEATFNQRQRAIIARAMRQPTATFTIKYHQTNHAISYATARRDLMELEEKRYLDMSVEGKTMVFRGSESIAELLERAPSILVPAGYSQASGE